MERYQSYDGATLSWELRDGVVELSLHRAPCNEIGSQTLSELELFVEAHECLREEAHALIISSRQSAGFCAGADLRELYNGAHEIGFSNAAPLVRDFLDRRVTPGHNCRCQWRDVRWRV